MKEFILTQPYANLEEMLNSAEVTIYKEELQQSNIEKYAIVSRIGNRYDLDGNKIEDFVDNPFIVKQEDVPVSYCEVTKEDVIEEASITVEKMLEDETMKYAEVEKVIDNEIKKAVDNVKNEYKQVIAGMKEAHAVEIEKVKEEVKAELIAKLTE